MPKTHRPYAPEFRQQMVELVQSGRTPEELALEYEPSAGAIRNWVAQQERDAGRREDGLSSDERQELRRLRRENKQLRIERDILKKQRPGSHGRATRSRSGVRVRESKSGRAGRCARCAECWVSPPAATMRGCAANRQRGSDGMDSCGSGSRRSGVTTAKCTDGRASTPSCGSGGNESDPSGWRGLMKQADIAGPVGAARPRPRGATRRPARRRTW